MFRLGRIDGARPEADAILVDPEHVRFGGKLLGYIIQNDRQCKRLSMAYSWCFVAQDLSPLVSEARQVLDSYTGPEDLHKVCTAATSVLQKIENEPGLSSFLMEPIVEHYHNGLKFGFTGHEYGRVMDYLNELRPKLESSASEMLDDAAFEGNDRETMTARYKAHIDYGMSILIAFEACLRAPESVRSGAYARWNSALSQAQSDVSETRTALEELRLEAEQINEAGRFRLLYWPYIVVLALALKFAKGVAAISPRRPG